jgi:hypothetical protein
MYLLTSQCVPYYLFRVSPLCTTKLDNCCRVVCTIPIISVNDIVISNVIRLRLRSNNSIVCTFPLDTPLDCQIVTPANFVI